VGGPGLSAAGRPRAELLADRGAAAEAPEFFRSRPFLDAEEVTHTLRIAAGRSEIAVPVIVREIPDAEGLSDAISPYGYPGATVSGAGEPLGPGEVEWSATGLVSLFARDRIGPPPFLRGATERSLVQVHDPARPPHLRSRFAEQIRRNERLGYAVEAIPSGAVAAERRDEFHALYTETMRRAGAAQRYLFAPSYFERILAFEDSWLVLASGPGGETAAGAIAARSDGLLHYYLGGTADSHLDASPFKNVVASMTALADELALPLNLGGGLRAGDGLEDFKRAFANAELPFHTHEIACDAAAYERLAGGRNDADFFPAYRAPA
jgi:hypothetical protein